MPKKPKLIILLALIGLIILYTVAQFTGWLLAAVLMFVLGSEFVNGFTDAPNAIGTVVATKALPFLPAALGAAVLNAFGATLGKGVAETIGKGIVDSQVITLETLAGALLGIIIFSSGAARFGIPTSESHALVAGLSGAALAEVGIGFNFSQPNIIIAFIAMPLLIFNTMILFPRTNKLITSGVGLVLGLITACGYPKTDVIITDGWIKVGVGIVSALIIGYIGSWLLGKLIIKTCSNLSPTPANKTFKILHIFSAGAMALGHGLNDGQKFIGVFTLALLLGGKIDTFEIQFWVVILCAGTMGIGTSFGGKKIIRVVGEKISRLTQWQGFTATTTAALIIEGVSHLGVPLSTTHTIVASITGTGASKKISAVRWKYPWHIVQASALTFPICGIIAFLTCKFLLLFK
ncbi:MAG TPA: inorganic phosphate transporter [Candidatus Paceibacterota bacterium]